MGTELVGVRSRSGWRKGVKEIRSERVLALESILGDTAMAYSRQRNMKPDDKTRQQRMMQKTVKLQIRLPRIKGRCPR